MKDRYPRTVAEFAEHSRRVVVVCEECRAHRTISPDVLSLTFGDGLEATARQLEFNAFIRARDGERPGPVRAPTRRRR